MRPGPKHAAAELMGFIGVSAPPKPVEDWLEALILDKQWRDTRTNARETAEAWSRPVLKALRASISGLHELGRPARIAFNSSSDYMLQGAAFVEGTDSEETREWKRRRARMDTYHAALAQLSARDFEFLCKGVLRILGVDDPKVTPAVADDGIDFYGRMRLERHIFAKDVYPSLQRQLSVWLVGQAKHFQINKVSTPDIRDLVGATILARGHAYSGADAPEKYKDLVLRPCDPVFSLFITTGQISREGWALLTRSGVVAMDGELLAAFLADRSIGVADGAFDSDAFDAWIADLKRK